MSKFPLISSVPPVIFNELELVPNPEKELFPDPQIIVAPGMIETVPVLAGSPPPATSPKVTVVPTVNLGEPELANSRIPFPLLPDAPAFDPIIREAQAAVVEFIVNLAPFLIVI